MKTYEENIKNIEQFATDNNIEFTIMGEIGFGRECVGLLKGNNYIEYNPSDKEYKDIPEFYDERLYDIAPENAYHKGSYLAVLGRGDEAIKQLSQWVDKLKKLGATIGSYKTGETGLQALFSGETAYCIKTNKSNN